MSFASTSKKLNTQLQESRFASIYNNAMQAGHNAVEGLRVTPMIVGTPTSIFNRDIDPTKPVYYVEDGVCGFANVQIKPATCAFAKWLVRNGYAYKDSYNGGISLSVREYNQSYQKKNAHAQAMATVFRNHAEELHLKSVYATSRLD